MRRPELAPAIQNINDVIRFQKLLRMPSYIIARKQDYFWRITEKIFVEDL
jgi:DNA repair protein RadD